MCRTGPDLFDGYLMEVPIARPKRWACFACCCPRPILKRPSFGALTDEGATGEVIESIGKFRDFLFTAGRGRSSQLPHKHPLLQRGKQRIERGQERRWVALRASMFDMKVDKPTKTFGNSVCKATGLTPQRLVRHGMHHTAFQNLIHSLNTGRNQQEE